MSLVVLAIAAVLIGSSAGGLLGTCGPFTDTAADSFCPFALEIFYLGITTGTTPTTYDPSGNVTRLQMAAFLSRTVDTTLSRAGHRAAQNRVWTNQNPDLLGVTTIGGGPRLLQFDGADLWVPNEGSVVRVRASDGRVLETWTGAGGAFGLTIGATRVFVTGQGNPSRLYAIDPRLPAGAVTTVASNLPAGATGVAFDGGRVWTANQGGSVSIITPAASIPWTVTSVTVGLGVTGPIGVLFDGANVWVTDQTLKHLVKLDGAGTVLQTITVGTFPFFPVYDGGNIWVPNSGSNSVTVVRASSGAVLETLTGNGLNNPVGGAFDGERVLITNSAGPSVSLWKAAGLTALGSLAAPAGSGPQGACSDGTHFWVADFVAGRLVRY